MDIKIKPNAVIDFHAHLWSDEYIDLLIKLGKSNIAYQRGVAADKPEALHQRFEAMQQAQIDMQVLSAAPLSPHFENKEHAIQAATFINDEYIQLAKTHPDKFLVFISLPLPSIEASLAEIARLIDRPNVVGVALTNTLLRKSIFDDEFLPILEELNKRKTILYIHPEGQGACSHFLQNNIWMTGTIVEDTIAVTELITKEIPIKYPGLKIINSHLGGALPMMTHRMDNQIWEVPHMKHKPSEVAKKMWYDTAAHASIPALKAAIAALGAENLVLGTDFPYIHFKDGNFKKNTQFIKDGASESDAQKILSANGVGLVE